MGTPGGGMGDRWSGWWRVEGGGKVGRAVRLGAAVLALAVLAGLVHVDLPVQGVRAGQEDNSGAGSNPLVGTWHQAIPAQVGGVIHTFMNFGTDGSYFSSAVFVDGPQNGLRVQLFGRYTIQPAANGLFQVTIYYKQKLPLQLCMQGVGCRPNGSAAMQPDRGLFQFQGDMFQSNNGFMGQRSGMPPALAQRLPAVWMLQPPPSINVPSGGGGRYVSPRNTTPGLGGNCDDLQQSRICTINDGVYHRDPNTGCMVCTK